MSDLKYAPHFNAIREALAPYESIWNHEVLHLNWNLEEVYSPEWIDSLGKLSNEEAFLLDTGRKIPALAPDLQELLARLKSLSKLKPSIPAPVEINPKTTVFIKEKKVHEISHLLGTLDKFKSSWGPLKIIDIGGGVGHLARAIAFETGSDVTTIDGSLEFQELGRKRLTRLRTPKGAGKISFKHNLITRGDHSPELVELFGSHHVSLGLHTCGNLALSHLDLHLTSNALGMINFGCCYNKLDPIEDVGVSEHVRKNSLELNLYALSLATRGYAKLELQDYLLKKRVKLFRYGLHFLLEAEFGVKFPEPVGECNTRIYWGDFHYYAKQKLAELGHTHNLSDTTIDNFLEQESITNQIEKMISCDLIRWQFGRPIELYILLDRALYLEEHGKSVEIREFFEETISPRNIGLICF